MSNIITIADVSIRQDDQGRYSLNDLHRAAGSEKRHGPSYWLGIQQTKELIEEMETTGIPVVTLEGRNGGTFVAKELVYAYAMWISPAFHLKVIRAYDQMQAQPALSPANLSRMQLIQLAMEAEQEKLLLEAKVQEQAPKVEAHDRIAVANGAMTIRETATTLEYPERKLVLWLIQNTWAYRRNGRKNLLGYAEMIKKGWLAHKVRTVEDVHTGEEKISEQLLVTPLGLTVLARKLQNPMLPSGSIPPVQNSYLAVRG
ncbi:phage antirepressor KilAC domain-containing protein [Alcaligenes faecalis subsp. phenolicus]|uniref:phage antirepressor KilAC domain-containing protein n=1 Tax=Alcaligenes nematophilus TaxID=2994643 RepID=UPI002AA37A37|nr:phage antirepressor KilAC domain-containing protein [Alcaligenes phenolicus]